MGTHEGGSLNPATGNAAAIAAKNQLAMVRSKQVLAIFTKHCLKETHLARRKRARLPHGLRCEKRDSHRGEHDAVHGRCGSVTVWWQQWRSVHALLRTRAARAEGGERCVFSEFSGSRAGRAHRGARLGVGSSVGPRSGSGEAEKRGRPLA
jgi:hypothetical protein